MRIVVIGGGIGGLLTALLLARDDHEIVVLERDADPVPGDAERAWEGWKRRGVNQFRQPHNVLSRAAEVMRTETPELWSRVLASGPSVIDWRRFAPRPEAVTKPADDALVAYGIRRTTLELVVAGEADRAPTVDVRRGVAVTGLVTSRNRGGIPRVSGVSTAGKRLRADLVVDASGRRTPVGQWVTDLGRPVATIAESDGFTYFSRWYRARSGSAPDLERGMLGGVAPGVVCLLFPADAGVFGVAMVGSVRDRPIRSLREPARFQALLERIGAPPPWVDPTASDPITDVKPMGAIQNRRLNLVADGEPALTGLVNVADSAVSTNPSLGRGVSLAIEDALALRQTIRDTGDAVDATLRHASSQEARLTPWLDDSIQSDESMRVAFQRAITGDALPRTPYPREILQRGALVDMDCWRAWTRRANVLDPADLALSDDALMGRAREAAAEAPPLRFDIDRRALLEVLE